MNLTDWGQPYQARASYADHCHYRLPKRQGLAQNKIDIKQKSRNCDIIAESPEKCTPEFASLYN